MLQKSRKEEIVVFSEDPLSSDAIKFALESKRFAVHVYDDLKNCLKHIILTPPALIILDEIQSGPSHGDIVSGIRKKLKDFQRPFLFILDPPKIGSAIYGFRGDIDGYIERPYTLNSLLDTVFLLMKIELTASMDEPVSKKESLKPANQTRDTTLSVPADTPEENDNALKGTSDATADKWLEDLKPLAKQQDQVDLIGDDEVISPLQQVGTEDDPEEKPTSAFSSYKGTILVVDDEPFIIRIIKTILESDGYRVLTADNGLEAMKKCKEIIPDLILLDLMMPEIDGYEFTEIIRSEKGFETLPIVILSARPLTQDQGQAFKLGVSFYMQKPIDREKLLGIIHNLISES